MAKTERGLGIARVHDDGRLEPIDGVLVTSYVAARRWVKENGEIEVPYLPIKLWHPNAPLICKEEPVRKLF